MIWREIRQTDGRYIINEEGRILDRKPQSEIFDWNVNLSEPREIFPDENDLIYYQLSNGKWKHIKLPTLLRDHFQDLYTIHKDEVEKIKRKIQDTRQPTITYSVDTLNKILFPNKVLIIYCTYNNNKHVWKKPFKFDMRERKSIVIKKGFNYFGVGTTNLIHFDNYYPKNAKPYVEHIQKQYDRKKASEKAKKQIHHTELWDDDQ